MSNPTREDIIRAHEALDTVCDLVTELRGFSANEYRNLIRAALPPQPQPTMTDVVWNDEEHFLAEAKIKNGPLVAMIGKDQEQWITCIPIEADPSLLCKRTEFEGYLTPTGKRYTLTEVQE